MSLRRPFSARIPEFQQKLSPFLSADARFKSNQNNQNVTEEEIFMMKQELQALVREKNILKNKIVKLMDVEKNSPKSHISKPSKNSLSKDIKELEEYNQKKKEEIDSFLQSDEFSRITEMQEETVILYEELTRMSELKKQIDSMVKEATANLEQTVKTFSPETINRNQKIINKLETEIALQEERNKIARDNLEISASKSDDQDIDHAKYVMQSSIQILQKRIEEEEKEIARLDAEIERQQNLD